MKAYARILNAVYSQVWAIQPEKLEAITGFLELKAAGHLPDADLVAEIHAASVLTAARAKGAKETGPGSVAVLPLYGMIMQRGNMVGDISGPRGTSIDQFKAQFRQAMADASVSTIVIDVDSPGGTVSGCDELATEIYNARGKKKVIAVANCLMASAAYYIACSAAEIVASPSSTVGSIGVYAAIRDESAMLEKQGIKVTLVTYGENKAEGDPRVPVTPSAVANLQKMVNVFGKAFDKAVARGLGVSMSHVREHFGQGAMFDAASAQHLGMVHRVASLDDVLAELGVGASSSIVRMSMSAHNGSGFAAVSAPSADGSGNDGAACECDCDGCIAGDCDDCTVEDCGFEGCTCPDNMAKQKKAHQASVDAAALRRKALIAAL